MLPSDEVIAQFSARQRSQVALIESCPTNARGEPCEGFKRDYCELDHLPVYQNGIERRKQRISQEITKEQEEVSE